MRTNSDSLSPSVRHGRPGLSVAIGLSLCMLGFAQRTNPALSQIGPDASQSEAASPAEEPFVTPEAQKAIDDALEYLASHQHADGSFGSGNYRGNVAVTSLAGLAFMSGGNTPGRGRYGQNVERALQYVLSKTSPDGFVCELQATSHGPMYDHGFGTLFLAECYGMSPQSELREKLTKAIGLIVQSQNSEGGWRYHPVPEDADVSVTVCQIMALRAARNAGLHVPKDVVERCIRYVKQRQNPDGGFAYRVRGEPSQFARSAAGVVALYSAGIYEGPEIQRGLDYLRRHLPRGGRLRRQSHYYYGHYYAVQAMWLAGGTYWEEWYPAIRDELLHHQPRTPEGAWTYTICNEYATAMACIVLQMSNNYLPIFQR